MNQQLHGGLGALLRNYQDSERKRQEPTLTLSGQTQGI